MSSIPPDKAPVPYSRAGRTMFDSNSVEFWKMLLTFLGTIVTAAFTSFVTYQTSKLQTQVKIDDLIEKSKEFQRLLKVDGKIVSPGKKTRFTIGPNEKNEKEIVCQGRIDKDLSDDFHLWICVEVDGFIYFKDSEIDVDREHGRWTKWFTEPVEPGQTKSFSIDLYVATADGNYQIQRWLEIGNDNKKFEKITTISNTVLVNRVDDIQIQNNNSHY